MHTPDHPRLRGVHGSERYLDTANQGSSPLTRGAHLLTGSSSDEEGIIPAYAGCT
ncbi:hypothetical protein HMPREF1531_01131, partial [Propionibacterium sp. oral taxon 192 str. F0372]